MSRLIKALIANETCADETEATILRWRGCA